MAQTFNTMIQEADLFVRQWTSGEITVNFERAKDLQITSQEEKNFWGRPKKRKTPFCNDLGVLISEYQLCRDVGTPERRYQSAFELLSLVNRAYAFGAIKNVKQQQRDYEQEIERLKEQVNILMKQNTDLALENKRFHNLYPDADKKGKGADEFSDVTRG